MTTGQRIRLARKNAGLTQKALGEKLEVSYQNIAQWENDLRNPKLKTLHCIAAALNIDVDELLPQAKPNPNRLFFQDELDVKMDSDSQFNIVPSFGSNLRRYREERGLSRKKLSELSHVPISEIILYEREESGHLITQENLNKISESLNVEPDKLLGYGLTADQVMKKYCENCRRQINEILDKLNPAGLDKARERLEEMAQITRYRRDTSEQ